MALPVALIPEVLEHLRWRSGDLAACCRVSRVWDHFARPALYERLWLRDQTRIVRVFRTLASFPHLVRFVKIIGKRFRNAYAELRVYPFGLPAEQLEALEEQILCTLHHATHLEALYWTRTGSLNDRLLASMFEKTQCLRRFEFTGNSRSWSPSLLVEKLPRSVQALTILLPDRAVAQQLVPLATHLEGRLSDLSILCMDTAVITDALLQGVAEHAPRLRRISLVGCKGVRGDGVRALVSPNVRDLALEGVALAPGIFASLVPCLARLSRLTVTYPRRQEQAPAFFSELGAVIESCEALDYLAVYARGGSAPVIDGEDDSEEESDALNAVDSSVHGSPSLGTPFVRRLAGSRAAHALRTLRIHGIGMSLHQLRILASSPLAARLEDLVVHLYEADVASLRAPLAAFVRIRSLHILSHLRSAADFTEDDMVELARAAGPYLQQIGFRNRVWLVEYSALAQRTLRRWDMAAGVFPESMLVVRA